MQPDDQPTWLRAPRCGESACVEIALTDSAVLVRDSKEPDVVLTFDRQEWAVFLDGVYSGRFRLDTDLTGRHHPEETR